MQATIPKNVQFLVFLFVLLTVFFLGCRKEIIVDDSDNKYPLTLNHIEKEEGSFLSWDKVNNANFKKYIIIGTSIELGYGFNPTDFSSSIYKVEIDDVDSLSVTIDDFISNSQKKYFKLYVDIGDRYIESQSVELNNEIFRTNSFQTFFYVDRVDSTIYVGTNPGSSLGTLSTLSYKNGLKTESITESSTFEFDFQTNLLIKSTESNKKYLYLVKRGEVKKFALPQLTIVNENSTGFSSPINCIVNNKDMLFAAWDNTNEALTGYRYNNTGLINIYGVQRPSSGLNRSMILIDPTKNTIVEFSSTLINVFDFNTNVTGNKTYQTPWIKTITQTASMDATKNFFIGDKEGNIMKKDFSLHGKIDCNSCQKFVFADDGKTVIAIQSDLVLRTSDLIFYDYISNKEIKRKTFKNIDIKDVAFGKKGSAYIIFKESFSSNGSLSITKINL